VRLSDGVEWGVHACTLLAALPPDAALPAARLAEYHGVPSAYLAKHLQSLARAGVLETVKGPRGGYRLARPPAEITVLDVVEAIDGEESAFRCTEIRRRGPTALPAKEYPRPCGIHRAFTRADDAWRKELAATTIESLVIGVVQEAPRVALEKAARWLGEAIRPQPAG
jgi:Rrf2 family protein